jgi:cell division protease FtsH
MVTRFGMEPTLGPVSYEGARSPLMTGPPALGDFHDKQYSDETARAIDAAIQEIVSRAFDRTVGILEAHHATLDRGAKLLLERETLDEAALKQLRDELRAAPLLPSDAPARPA